MKDTIVLNEKIQSVIAYLFIVLFAYAAFSKLSDYETFTVQLGQSPLLSVFAGWIAWFIPAVEILISILFMFTRTKFLALTASFTLMMLFTAYIFIISHYSDYVPCSCGGILERMSWTAHFYFNILFCLLAAVAIIFSQERLPIQKKGRGIWHKLILLVFLSIFAVGIVVGLFVKSEQIIHQENNFVRRYPPHLYDKVGQLDLKYAGSYFAGVADDTIYLGNYHSPLTIVAISSDLKGSKEHKIRLSNYDLPYRAATVRVLKPYFFLTDGTVPCLFKGQISSWDANQINIPTKRFSAFEPTDSMTAVIRSRKPQKNESRLGLLTFSRNDSKIYWNDQLLQKQIDGVFDCDGMLRYNDDMKKSIYTYYYRNQFIVADKYLKTAYRGNTIDTTTKANIKIAVLKNGDKKLSVPGLMVNNLTATTDDKLFVNSNLRAHYESLKMWQQALAIDVYNLDTKAYEYSFYVYRHNNEKPLAMFAAKDIVYFLFSRTIVAYRIDHLVIRQRK